MSDQFDYIREAFSDLYDLERKLGAGAMARVYLAHDKKHDREVAIKVLRNGLTSVLGPERFLREIRVTAQLNHPNILPVLDSGEADRLLYYVMPYVQGETLEQKLEREGPQPLKESVRVAGEVADALGAAHDAGIVHRDIKPANIMIQGGRAIVADFGIARAIGSAGGDRLTETGMVVGTPMYMSPEQASGVIDLSGRSDIYSLACVVFEMVTGEPPFSASDAGSMIRRHLLDEPPAVTVQRPDIPEAFGVVLQRALAKLPDDRFERAVEFGRALADPNEYVQQQFRSESWARRIWRRWTKSRD